MKYFSLSVSCLCLFACLISVFFENFEWAFIYGGLSVANFGFYLE